MTDYDHDEILRLRERLHKVESGLAEQRLRMSAMAETLDRVDRHTSDLIRADQVEHAVHSALNRRGPAIPWNWITKALALMVAVGSLVNVYLNLRGH